MRLGGQDRPLRFWCIVAGARSRAHSRSRGADGDAHRLAGARASTSRAGGQDGPAAPDEKRSRQVWHFRSP